MSVQGKEELSDWRALPVVHLAWSSSSLTTSPETPGKQEPCCNPGPPVEPHLQHRVPYLLSLFPYMLRFPTSTCLLVHCFLFFLGVCPDCPVQMPPPPGGHPSFSLAGNNFPPLNSHCIRARSCWKSLESKESQRDWSREERFLPGYPLGQWVPEFGIQTSVKLKLETRKRGWGVGRSTRLPVFNFVHRCIQAVFYWNHASIQTCYHQKCKRTFQNNSPLNPTHLATRKTLTWESQLTVWHL